MAMNTFNPARIMLGANSSGLYTPGTSQPPKNPANPTDSNVVGPGAIRATGSGPFDSAYRQNLATYAGGLMSNPSGLLQFNPTNITWGNESWNPAPQTLNQQALGGQPFNYNPQPPTPPANTPIQTGQPSNSDYWKFWLQQYNNPFENTPQSY